MAINLQIDDTLLQKAQQLGNFTTEQETVEQALKEFVEHHKQLEMLELEGEIDYFEDYDYKAQRRKR